MLAPALQMIFSMTKKARGLFLLAAIAMVASCAAMHRDKIRRAEADGHSALAGCYRTCEEGSLTCLNACDRKHPRLLHVAKKLKAGAPSPEANQGNAALELMRDPAIQQAFLSAAKKDRQRRRARKASASRASSPSPSYASSSSSRSSHRRDFSTSHKRIEKPNCGTKTCAAGQRCQSRFAGSLQCYPGGQCVKLKADEHTCVK